MSEQDFVVKCIKNEDVAILQDLRDMGWNINERTNKFGHWLHYAIETHNHKIAEWLVTKSHEDGKQGFVFLREACEIIILDTHGIGFYEDRGNDHATMLKKRWKPVLVKCLEGIDDEEYINYVLFFMGRSCRWMMRAVLKGAGNLNYRDDENNTLLHQNFVPDSYLTLLEHGLDVNLTNDRGFTPLHTALLGFLTWGPGGGQTYRLAMLLVFGANPNIPDRPAFYRPAFLPSYRELLQRVQMEVEDARERVHMKAVSFCMLTHAQLGHVYARSLHKDILEQCIRPTHESTERLILKELGILEQ
jgi:hypothetical protein